MTTNDKIPLIRATENLNEAIDCYWNSDYGLRLTGMGENFAKSITGAQHVCFDSIKGLPERDDVFMIFMEVKEWQFQLGILSQKYIEQGDMDSHKTVQKSNRMYQTILDLISSVYGDIENDK